MKRKPRRAALALPDGVGIQQVLEGVTEQPERHREMRYCECDDRHCRICGEPLDRTTDHVALSVRHHDPAFTVPGVYAPLSAHARCWQAVLDHGRKRLEERAQAAMARGLTLRAAEEEERGR